MDDAQRRKAANEAVFRNVNEQIEGLRARFAVSAAEPLRLVCECDRLDCAESIQIDLDDYERVRADATLFLVLPGHEDAAVEDVVDAGDHHLIVRKRPGEPSRIARESNPRS